jgi:hypothetical protein
MELSEAEVREPITLLDPFLAGKFELPRPIGCEKKEITPI